jgi:hypothetical protein
MAKCCDYNAASWILLVLINFWPAQCDGTMAALH